MSPRPRKPPRTRPKSACCQFLRIFCSTTPQIRRAAHGIFGSPQCTGLQSLCENFSSGPKCAAPTVLKIMIAIVPSPSGLGYDLSRLRRSGFIAVDWESSRGNSRPAIGNSWFVLICELPISAGGAEDCSPVRKHWVHERTTPSAVGAADDSAGKSYDLQ